MNADDYQLFFISSNGFKIAFIVLVDKHVKLGHTWCWSIKLVAKLREYVEYVTSKATHWD